MMPTPIEAQSLWLATTGMDAAAIARATGRTPASVATALSVAQRKATAIGLRMVVIRPWETSKTESGFSALQRLAREAGLR
jgi:phage terminase large subunit